MGIRIIELIPPWSVTLIQLFLQALATEAFWGQRRWFIQSHLLRNSVCSVNKPGSQFAFHNLELGTVQRVYERRMEFCCLGNCPELWSLGHSLGVPNFVCELILFRIYFWCICIDLIIIWGIICMMRFHSFGAIVPFYKTKKNTMEEYFWNLMGNLFSLVHLWRTKNPPSL